LTVERSTPGSAPPAAAMTSATRAPAFARTRPGLRTFPATWTTTSLDGLDVVPAATGLPATGLPDMIPPGGSTGRGRERNTDQPVQPSPTTRTRAMTITCFTDNAHRA